MKLVVTTALVLLLLFFLLPLLLFPAPPAAVPPAPTATLPVDRAPPRVSELDKSVTVRVSLEGGEIVSLTMRDYLWRVVAAEMPASFEPEALKAQAAAARTYALVRLSTVQSAHPQADVCDDITCCQAYLDPEAAAQNWGEGAAHYTQKIADAVAATDGMAILYDGQPIDAVFFSSAAGRTMDAVEVWGSAVPYLTGVESPEGEEVPNYHTGLSFTPAEFKALFLANYPGADLSGEPSGWFGTAAHTSNGAVDTVAVGGVAVRGTALRTLLGLRSAHFTVRVDDGQILFETIGYGHAVGMSQYGANALAKQGKGWQEIVQWYYTGVAVAPWSPDGDIAAAP